SNVSKQFIHIYGKPVLAHTLQSFENCEKINSIFVVVPKGCIAYCFDEIIGKYSFKKVKEVVEGGNTRQDSVYNALKRIPEKCRIVSIHDGVRPLITSREIGDLVSKLVRFNKKDETVKGVIIASPAYETVKKIDYDNLIDHTITRSLVCMAQTPQTFFFKELLEAYKKAKADDFTGTDDASLVERMGWKVKVFIGHHENIKITTPLDLFLAELIMHRNGKVK
ncbi:MAG: 2-C-methyl-D-erythritol 4-phosphate cytidylyltransferase, partial [Actinobacteria bacterium]|nr:2-C-methyl-D-erythritol 4-phosphate cytidylyltransferase [Actinomycetota bacterium]